MENGGVFSSLEVTQGLKSQHFIGKENSKVRRGEIIAVIFLLTANYHVKKKEDKKNGTTKKSKWNQKRHDIFSVKETQKCGERRCLLFRFWIHSKFSRDGSAVKPQPAEKLQYYYMGMVSTLSAVASRNGALSHPRKKNQPKEHQHTLGAMGGGGGLRDPSSGYVGAASSS